MKWFVRLMLISALLGLLAFGGLFATVQLVDVAKVRQKLEKEVLKASGRELVIAGEMSTALGLSPSVVLGKVTLANPSWAKSKQMLAAERVAVQLDLWPLLQGKIRLANVQVQDAVIHLERSAKGRESWNMPVTPAADDAKPASPNFLIRHLELFNAELHYVDHRADQRYDVAVERLDVERLTRDGVEQFTLKGAYQKHQLAASGALVDGGLLMVKASLDGKAVNATLDGSLAMQDMTHDLKLAVNADRLKDVLKLAGIASDAVEPLTLSAAIGGTPEVLTVNAFTGKLGDHSMQGKGVVNLSGKRPYVQATLHMPSLRWAEAGHVVPAIAQDDAEAKKTQPSKANPLLPWDLLQRWNADVTFSLDQLSVQGVAMNQLKATMKLADGALTVTPFVVALAQGEVSGSLWAQATSAPPQMKMDLLFDKVVLGDVINALAEQEQLRGGATRAQLKLAGSGVDWQSWLTSSQGSWNVFVDKASYRVTAGKESVDDFLSLLRGSDDESKALRVECAVGRFDVRQGVATSTLLALKTSGAIADGSGTVSLPDSTMDLVLRARSGLVGLADVVPPMRFKGAIADPSIYPDAGGTLLGIGKMVLGAASGVGLVAVLGEKAADRLGITADNNPCLTAIAAAETEAKSASQKPAAEQLKQRYDATEKAIRTQRDAAKESYQNLRDGVKGLLGN